MSNDIVAVKQLLEQRRESFLQVLPKTGIDPERFFRLAVYASQNQSLAQCDRTSVVRSIYAAAALGLSLDPTLGHAYIVPRRVNGQQTAQLQPGYRGLIELALRSGRISQVHAEVVDASDVFEVEKGTSRRIVHKPLVELGLAESSGLRAAYVTWKDMSTGSMEFHVIGQRRIERAKKASQTVGKSFSPWASDEAAMWLKTAVHDCKRFWSLSPELARAVDLDIRQATGQAQAVGDTGDEMEAEEHDAPVSLDSLNDDAPAPPADDTTPAATTTQPEPAAPSAVQEAEELTEPIEGEQPDGPPPIPHTHDDLVDVVAYQCGLDMNEAAKRLRLEVPKGNWDLTKSKAGWWTRFIEGEIKTLVPLKTWKKQPA